MSNDTKHPPAVSPVDSGSQALAEALRSSFAIVKYLMVALFVLFLFSGMFKVEPQEKAIVLRFGKPQGDGEKALLGSGLHWAFPYPIDEVIKIPISEIQKVTTKTAWFLQSPEQEQLNQDPPPAGLGLNPAVDGYALTGDGNIVHVQATLSYRIEDPVRCIFEFVSGTNGSFGLAGVSNAVVNALDNALAYTVAHYKMDDLLLNDATGFQDAVTRRVVQLVSDQKLGIAVDLCTVRSREPLKLKETFAKVTTTSQTSSTALNEARRDADQILSRARSDATNRIRVAEADRDRMVQELSAFAKTFEQVLPHYQSNPDLFMQQRLVETMGRMFTNATDKLLLTANADGKPGELRLLLNREPPKPRTPSPTP